LAAMGSTSMMISNLLLSDNFISQSYSRTHYALLGVQDANDS